VADANVDPQVPPPHIADSVKAIARLHTEHHQEASRLQRAVDRTTAVLASPAFVGVLSAAVLGWIGANLMAPAFGYRPVDPPPFSWLTGAVSLCSLYLVVLVLATQRREERLAQLREQVTLELVVLCEQKLAKVIQLLEESRQDNPLMRDRVDSEANAMAAPADAQSMIKLIKETHAEAERVRGPSSTAAP